MLMRKCWKCFKRSLTVKVKREMRQQFGRETHHQRMIIFLKMSACLNADGEKLMERKRFKIKEERNDNQLDKMPEKAGRVDRSWQKDDISFLHGKRIQPRL